MSGPIQSRLAGYLGFFQLKNAGVNPRDLADFVQPVAELRDWYFSSGAGPLAADQNVLIAGGFDGVNITGIAVPSNEMWFVQHYSLFAQLTATDNISLAPAMQFDPNTGGAHLLSDGMLGAAPLVGTAAGRTVGVTARDFFAPPGAIFGIAVGECISGGNVTVSQRIRGARLAPI